MYFWCLKLTKNRVTRILKCAFLLPYSKNGRLKNEKNWDLWTIVFRHQNERIYFLSLFEAILGNIHDQAASRKEKRERSENCGYCSVIALGVSTHARQWSDTKNALCAVESMTEQHNGSLLFALPTAHSLHIVVIPCCCLFTSSHLAPFLRNSSKITSMSKTSTLPKGLFGRRILQRY